MVSVRASDDFTASLEETKALNEENKIEMTMEKITTAIKISMSVNPFAFSRINLFIGKSPGLNPEGS
jgi:hypothetical protein